MKKRKFAPLIALALSAMPGSAVASVIGLPGDTFSTTWDMFPATPGPPSAPTFTDAAPDSTTGQVTATAGQNMSGALMLGGGDRIYSMFSPFDVTVSGKANTSIPLIGIVLKFTSPSTVPAGDYFTILLNGVAADSKVFAGSSAESAGEFQIYQWYWTDLGLSTEDTFEFSISGAGDQHVSLDAIQIVPEPGSALLGVLGAAMLVSRRRRK